MSPAPTFENNRDRLTYLLAEYRVLFIGLVLGGLCLVAYYQPQAPTLPNWIPAVLVGWLVFAIPCFLAGKKIARWLRQRNWVEVHHVNAATDDVEKHYVPPEMWAEKEIPDDAPDPYPINGGSAWAVREYEYLSDIDEVRVEGVWLSGLEDTALYTSKSMMVDMHGWMLDNIEKLADTRAKWSRGVVEYEQKTVNDMAEARERGVTLDRTSGRDVFANISGDEGSQIPKLDTEDMPDIEDHKGMGDGPTPTKEQVEQARQREGEL